MRGTLVVEVLNLTDEQALDMLTHNWSTYHQHLVPVCGIESILKDAT
jgi:hypothetical protein